MWLISPKVHVVVVGPREMRHGRSGNERKCLDHSLIVNGRKVGNEPNFERISKFLLNLWGL